MITIPEPEWDISSCDRLAALLEPAAHAQHVIIDMSAVRYMDSTCLTKMILMHRKRAESGFDAASVVIADRGLRRLFQVAGLDDVWPIFETLDAARENSKPLNPA